MHGMSLQQEEKVSGTTLGAKTDGTETEGTDGTDGMDGTDGTETDGTKREILTCQKDNRWIVRKRTESAFGSAIFYRQCITRLRITRLCHNQMIGSAFGPPIFLGQ